MLLNREPSFNSMKVTPLESRRERTQPRRVTSLPTGRLKACLTEKYFELMGPSIQQWPEMSTETKKEIVVQSVCCLRDTHSIVIPGKLAIASATRNTRTTKCFWIPAFTGREPANYFCDLLIQDLVRGADYSDF